MPYWPTHKENICLMDLLTNNKYMPYGPTYKQQIYALRAYLQRKLYALWAYSQRKYMPYGPTYK